MALLKNKRKGWVMLFRGAIVATVASIGLASVVAAEEWNLPAGFAEQNYHTVNLNWFSDQVREATDGDINIIVHPNSSLVVLPEIKRAVQSGQVPIGEILLANYGNEDAIFEADMVPFLARGVAESRELYNAQRSMLEERFAQQNMVMLYSVCWPGNGVFSARELPTMGAMDGMRFRAYNAITERIAEQFGAQPVTVQAPELAQAFYTGLAEVMVAAPTIVENVKGWEFGDYFYDIRAFHPRSAVVVNRRIWEGLPDETRDAITEIAAEAEDRGWRLCDEAEAKSIQALIDNGMNVVEPDPEMMQEFADAVRPLLDEWEERAGADGTELRKAMGR